MDDVIRMHTEGVSSALIVRSIEQHGAQRALTPDEMIQLTKAGVEQSVIEAFMGTPDAADTTTDAAPAAVQETPKEPSVPRLQVSTDYVPGSKSFVLRSESDLDYTQVVLTANGKWVYRLPPGLKARSSDRIHLRSFEMKGSSLRLEAEDGIQVLSITAREGQWSQRY